MVALKFHTRLWVVLASMLQGGVNADEVSHRKAVDELFELTGMKQIVDRSVDNMLALQLRQNPALAKHRDVVQAFLEKHMGWERTKVEVADMYLKEFTEQELTEMNAFYRTPTGQKVIKRVPELMLQRSQLAVQRLHAHREELEKQFSE